jgi:hypothetical protein
VFLHARHAALRRAKHRSEEQAALGRRLSVMDPTKIRMRYLAGILVAAVITAAVLRHTLHVHAGFTRQEIAILAFVALAAVLTAVVLIRRRRRD